MSAENDNKSATGQEQTNFAGTNPARYGDTAPVNEQDLPVNPEEAQNVSYDGERLSGEDAEHAANKATEGLRQGRGD